jgi:hypothetical protein
MTTISSYNPYVSSPTAPSTSSPAPSTGASSFLPTLSGFSTDFTSISSMVAHAGGGGFASYKLSGQMADSMKGMFGNGVGGFFGGMKNVAVTGLKGAGLSALVSAGVSAVANGVGAATGKVDSSQAVTNVVKDTIGGALGGLTGVAAGGVGAMIFRGGGVMGTVISVGLGAVGGVLGGQVAKKLTENF